MNEMKIRRLQKRIVELGLGGPATDKLIAVLHDLTLRDVILIVQVLEPFLQRISLQWSMRSADAAREALRMEWRALQKKLREPLPLLDTKGVADRLNVSVRTVERLVAAGELEAVHIAGARRFPPDMVEVLIRKGKSGKLRHHKKRRR